MEASIPVAAGFIAVAVFMIFYEKNRQKRITREYDEMQIRIRGKGAWYAFYSMVLYMAVYMILEKGFGFRMLSASDALFLGVMVSGSVVVGYAILHNSYYGMNQTGRRNLMFILIIAVMEIVSIFMLVRLCRAGVFSSLSQPITDERILIVLCLPLFTTILIASLVSRMRPEEEDD